jgi:hypothetical protein
MVHLVVAFIRTSTRSIKGGTRNKRGVVPLWFALGMMTVCASCETPPGKAEAYPDRAFRAAEWIRDSTGCLQYRARNYRSLAQNEDFFRGKPAAYIVQLLGRPSFFPKRQGHRASNKIGYVVDCTELPTLKTEAFQPKPVYSTQYAPRVVFNMREDTCQNVSVEVP